MRVGSGRSYESCDQDAGFFVAGIPSARSFVGVVHVPGCEDEKEDDYYHALTAPLLNLAVV
jgi:hypothetical protein